MTAVATANFSGESEVVSKPLSFADEAYPNSVWAAIRMQGEVGSYDSRPEKTVDSFALTIMAKKNMDSMGGIGGAIVLNGKYFLVSLLNSLSPKHEIKRIAEDLKYLGYSNCAEDICWFHDDNDLEEGEQPLNPESAKGFLSFITQFGDLGEPMLGPFPEGTLSVEWRIADNKHLLVEPLDSKNACFALIAPSDSLDSPDGKLYLNGRGTIKDIIKTLRKYEVGRWRKG